VGVDVTINGHGKKSLRGFWRTMSQLGIFPGPFVFRVFGWFEGRDAKPSHFSKIGCVALGKRGPGARTRKNKWVS